MVEIGCGTGEIARALAPHVERIDAIDISAPMLAKARSMQGGDHSAIRWIHGPAETARLHGPYALAIIGDALHWMEWDVVLRSVADSLSLGARIALISAVAAPLPWAGALTEIIGRYSVMQDFRPYNFIKILQETGAFEVEGDANVGSQPFTRTADEYIDSLHATAGLPRERMGADNANAFDEEVRTLVRDHVSGGRIEMTASGRVVWGSPAMAHP